ncbi:MAG TPA: response regulator [Kofleriaceae bacterium]|jgi:CheY-like chemotaxis protein
MSEARGTILVVDDEIDVLEMIELGLRSAGYQMLTADSGERAIEIFGQQKADLVICDLKMPKMNGIATISRLREQDPGLPVVVLTGYLGPQTIEECEQLGGVEVVRKPFLFRELSKAVKVALRRR